jgi:ABC-type spermidine/putrescine transport system permease subunit II
VGILSALLSVPLATMAAYAAQGLTPRIRRGMMLLVMLPVCLPPAALATGLLPLVFLTKLWGTMLSLVLVHAAMGLPIAYLIVHSHLTDRLLEWEFVARGLGASRWQSVWRVTLPLLRMPLAAAAISVFVLSLNETMISLFLATPDNETLPAVSWPELRFAASPLVAVSSCATAILGTMGILAVVGIESKLSRQDQ